MIRNVVLTLTIVCLMTSVVGCEEDRRYVSPLNSEEWKRHYFKNPINQLISWYEKSSDWLYVHVPWFAERAIMNRVVLYEQPWFIELGNWSDKNHVKLSRIGTAVHWWIFVNLLLTTVGVVVVTSMKEAI